MSGDRLQQFREMLDPKKWPVRDGEYVIVDGEVYQYRTDHPLEERVYRALFVGRYE